MGIMEIGIIEIAVIIGVSVLLVTNKFLNSAIDEYCYVMYKLSEKEKDMDELISIPKKNSLWNTINSIYTFLWFDLETFMKKHTNYMQLDFIQKSLNEQDIGDEPIVDEPIVDEPVVDEPDKHEVINKPKIIYPAPPNKSPFGVKTENKVYFEMDKIDEHNDENNKQNEKDEQNGMDEMDTFSIKKGKTKSSFFSFFTKRIRNLVGNKKKV